MARTRQQKIRVSVTRPTDSRFRVGGWLCGRHTYLWFGEEGKAGAFYGTLGDYRLYRLAKAIVRHYEAEK